MFEDKSREIRIQLRRAMNGIVSASMRGKGVEYKLNFGVSLPKIKEIARTHTPDAALAEALWKEDVRELKILATLLYPVDQFTADLAVRWTSEVKHQEIAEQYCLNLLQQQSFARELAAGWISSDEEYTVVIGFTLYARLCMKGVRLSEEQAASLLREARLVMDQGLSRKQRAAILALKHYGRQSEQQMASVLAFIADYPSSESPEKQEFYDDLFFEFEYYRN